MKTNVSIEWCIEQLQSDANKADVIAELQRTLKRRYEEAKNEIHIVWCIDDVFSLMFPEEDGTRGHTDEERETAREVLEAAKRNHDAAIGINWDVLQVWLDEIKKEVK